MKKATVPVEFFLTLLDTAIELAIRVHADAVMVFIEDGDYWQEIKQRAQRIRLVIATDQERRAVEAQRAGLETVLLRTVDAAVYEKLTQALLHSVADDLLPSGADVIVIYSGFEPDQLDSLSLIKLDERLGRLTARDLRQLETKVPLDTLKTVVDLAVEIGREGREGKPVGTLFVVGDTRKVLASSQTIGFDPVRGYNRRERNLHDHRVREALKEFASLDGAIIIGPDGTIEAACRLLDVTATNITLSKGLGARHWAAAAISKKTSAVAIAVSESTGTVRIFQNGEVILRIEPFRRAMKWKDFEYEPPSLSE
jgi:DNA integrity scanning protein DisA with diadenylate cyclase activity